MHNIVITELTRNQMIQLALLVGSDYTTGVAGIGPVTALEILAAFPAEGDNVLHGLHNFCSWIKKGRIVAPGKTSLRNKLRNVKLDKGERWSRLTRLIRADNKRISNSVM